MIAQPDNFSDIDIRISDFNTQMTVKYSTAMCYVSPQERATLAIRAICVVSSKKGTGRENLRHLYISGWAAVEKERKVILEWSIYNIVLVSQTSMLLASLL